MTLLRVMAGLALAGRLHGQHTRPPAEGVRSTVGPYDGMPKAPM